MTLTHNGIIDIATGRSRKEVNWRNKEILWSDVVKRLSETHRTAETHAEYLLSKRERQAEIKDVGGFVGGFLSGGRRKAGNVAHRQLLTLDLDEATGQEWETFKLCYDFAACIYSTHKHSPDKPRLRLVIPLNREIAADEYEPIGRMVASWLGINAFDDTTFQPHRLMYWPSTSSDGEYLFDYQDGPWLSADEVLGLYGDWKDSSHWPVSDRVQGVVQRAIKKQGDPLEKPGIVGAFCRAYTIQEAIEAFLTDMYEPCATEGRYTYKEGSTSGGLITYEDKFAFSHHGTDPVSGKLCNAFDLVRLHKYGLKDEDAREGTPGNKLPSYTEMLVFAAQQPRVRQLIGTERLAEAKLDFEEVDIEDIKRQQTDDSDWLKDLEADKKGHYKSTIDNIVLILENDPMLKGIIAFDEFEQRAIAKRNLPWRKITPATRYLIDRDDDNITHYLEKMYEISSGPKFERALGVIYEKTKFHPIRNYLDNLVWDGIPRVDHLLTDYMGVSESEYASAVIRKTLVAAVTRVFNPGAKFDYVLVLVGDQGLKKSSLVGKLGREWYSDSFSTVQGKEAFEQIQGVWLMEMGELAGLRKAEVEAIKHFISKRKDRYRVAYGHRTENFPRQCVFFGTTNNRDFLRDPTGNRRFWPVDVHEITPVKDVFRDLTDEEVNQVWAEAMHLYKAGETLYLSPELEAQAAATQASHTVENSMSGLIQEFVETLLPDNWNDMVPQARYKYIAYRDETDPVGKVKRNQVCAAEIWCEMLGKAKGDMNAFNTKDIHEALQNLEGWRRSKWLRKFPNYGQQKAYERIENTLLFEALSHKKLNADK